MVSKDVVGVPTQELAALQGLGADDWLDFGLCQFADGSVKDFLGNACLGQFSRGRDSRHLGIQS